MQFFGNGLNLWSRTYNLDSGANGFLTKQVKVLQNYENNPTKQEFTNPRHIGQLRDNWVSFKLVCYQIFENTLSKGSQGKFLGYMQQMKINRQQVVGHATLLAHTEPLTMCSGSALTMDGATPQHLINYAPCFLAAYDQQRSHLVTCI